MIPGYRLCRRCQYIQTTDAEQICTACRTFKSHTPEWNALVERWEKRKKQ